MQIADAVAREKAIDRQVVITAMEDAIQKAADFVDKQLSDAFQQSLQDGKTRILHVKSQLTGILGTYVVCPFTFAGTGKYWLMVFTAPNAEIMASVTHGVIMIVIAGIVLLVLSLGFLYWQVNRAAKVLSEITEGTTSASVVGSAA